jgi:hypothetical protein
MTTRKIAFAVITLSVLITARAAVAAAPQHGKTEEKSAPSVTGRWSMSVKGSPHGDVTMGLELTQEGKKVSGTFATPHGDDLQVAGEFAENTLNLATTNGGESKISMTAKLKEDGTLDGYLSSQMGDMTWTARRVTRK